MGFDDLYDLIRNVLGIAGENFRPASLLGFIHTRSLHTTSQVHLTVRLTDGTGFHHLAYFAHWNVAGRFLGG